MGLLQKRDELLKNEMISSTQVTPLKDSLGAQAVYQSVEG